MFPLTLTTLLALVAAAVSGPACEAPGYCAAGAGLVGYSANTSPIYCWDLCQTEPLCGSFYTIFSAINGGCFLVGEGCTAFQPMLDQSDNGSVIRYRYWQRECPQPET